MKLLLVYFVPYLPCFTRSVITVGRSVWQCDCGNERGSVTGVWQCECECGSASVNVAVRVCQHAFMFCVVCSLVLQALSFSSWGVYGGCMGGVWEVYGGWGG